MGLSENNELIEEDELPRLSSRGLKDPTPNPGFNPVVVVWG